VVGQHLQDRVVDLASYGSAESLPANGSNHGDLWAALRCEHAGTSRDLKLFPDSVSSGAAWAPAAFRRSDRGTTSRSRLPASRSEPGSVGRWARCHTPSSGEGRVPPRERRGNLALSRRPNVRGVPRKHVRRTVSSYYHPAGACPLWTDARAVLDLELRVHEVAGRPVADALVMPASRTPSRTRLSLPLPKGRRSDQMSLVCRCETVWVRTHRFSLMRGRLAQDGVE
jgi:choline dehydrogenase